MSVVEAQPEKPKNGRELWIKAPCQIAQMIITDGGVGDLIACTVAAAYNIKMAPEIMWRVFCPDYLVCYVEHVLQGTHVVGFSDALKFFDQMVPTRTTEWCNEHSAMRTHPVDYGFHMLADRHIYDPYQKSYLQVRPEEIDISGFKLPKKYVCITATGVEAIKTLSAETINDISDFVLSQGYVPVYLGKKTSKAGYKEFAINATITDADFSKGINLIDKTDLLQAAGIIAGAKAWIGCDGGLMHLAGCTDTPIVCGFTLVDPYQVAPLRKGRQDYKFWPIEPDPDVPGRYYQSKTHVFTPGDYRKFRGWEKVIENLTADKFIRKLSYLLL